MTSSMDIVELLQCVARSSLAYLNNMQLNSYQLVQKFAIQDICIFDIRSYFPPQNSLLIVKFEFKSSSLRQHSLEFTRERVVRFFDVF